MLRTARLMWRLHSSLAAVGARPTTPHSSARQLPSLVYQSQIDYSRFVSVPPLQRRCVIVAAAGSGAGTHAEEAPSSAVAVELQQRVAKLLKSRLPSYCSGCGVKLQQDDADRPGFFQVPRRLLDMAAEQVEVVMDIGAAPVSAEERERRRLDLALEAWLDEQQQGPAANRANVPAGDAAAQDVAAAVDVKCARCFSLLHSGKVLSATAEGELPEFDLARKVGRKIALQRDRKAVVLCVLDVADFDGSLPRAALSALFPSFGQDAPLAQDPASLPFTLTVAVNKFDLLPSQAKPGRVEQWARARLRQAGLPRPSRLWMVSAATGLGVRDMMRGLREELGYRGDLWVVGAQNAGKSSIITAMRRAGGSAAGAGGGPTVAPVPGTTLGLLRVPGVPLGAGHRTFDTPGVHHGYQLTSSLTLPELREVLPRKRLKPRTYRLPVGHCISLGGLAAVELVSAPSATAYLTVFVADAIVTHAGRADGAEALRERHVGGLLTPPFEPGRTAALRLVPRSAVIEGNSWREHARDVAIAGLGWVGVGVKGTAELRMWVPEGVMVTVHDALIPDFAQVFQRPGFSALLPRSAKTPSAGAALDATGGGAEQPAPAAVQTQSSATDWADAVAAALEEAAARDDADAGSHIPGGSSSERRGRQAGSGSDRDRRGRRDQAPVSGRRSGRTRRATSGR